MTETFARLNRSVANQIDWVIRLLAIWLFFSPWILQFGRNAPAGGTAANGALHGASNASWNAWILGVLVFLVSLSAMRRNDLRQDWINLILGAWIFIAPWVLGFATGEYSAAAWDHWIVGALIAILASVNISRVRTVTETHPPMSAGESEEMRRRQ